MCVCLMVTDWFFIGICYLKNSLHNWDYAY